MTSRVELVNRQKAPLATPSDIEPEAVTQISAALNILLADVFVLYFKTKNFHWHMSGKHFRDYHLMLDEHALVVPMFISLALWEVNLRSASLAD